MGLLYGELFDAGIFPADASAAPIFATEAAGMEGDDASSGTLSGKVVRLKLPDMEEED